jgi:muskelin
MCEEVPPIRALNFLQNEVSSVVDHRSAEETEMFRSLLTHLLAPPPVLVPTHTTEKMTSMSTSSRHDRHSPLHSSNSSNSTTPTALEHEDSRESSSRPKKRSRSDPDEGSEGEVWTSEIADYPEGFGNGSSSQRLRDMVDPQEAMIRGEDGRGGAPGVPRLTGARYSQRSEVFEYLLKFIADSEKQPADSLLDLVG